MNYRESDFHNTFSNSDDKFNQNYEKGLDDATLHGNSAFNTNSEKYKEEYQSGSESRSHDRYEVTGYEDTTGTNGDATMPPPVQLTKRFQEREFRLHKVEDFPYYIDHVSNLHSGTHFGKA